jgi:hypothetical protein
MTSIRTSIVAGFALFALTGIAGSVPAEAQLLTPSQLKAYEASRGQSRCPRSMAQTNEWVGNLTKALARSEAKADANPIYLADVGYYKTELGFAKTCGRTAAR